MKNIDLVLDDDFVRELVRATGWNRADFDALDMPLKQALIHVTKWPKTSIANGNRYQGGTDE